MAKYLFINVLLFLSTATYGQQMVFDDPVRLEEINSDAEEINPVLFPDGNKMFFVRGFHPDNVGGQYAGMDIWVSERDSLGFWSKPQNRILNGWNNHENNAVIGVRKDGQVVYLLNSYEKGKGIAFSKLRNGKWIKPEILDLKWVKRQQFVDFYMHPDFDVLLISMEGRESIGKEDLYVCLKDSLGNWQAPQHLGSSINTQGFEISPFLSYDKKRLYFSSDGHDGYGNADIYMSERTYQNWTVWSKPINLGNKINSEGFDAYFTLTSDSTVYFSSNRAGGLSDIYKSRIPRQTKLLSLRELFKVIDTEENKDKQYLSSLEASKIFGGDQFTTVSFEAQSYDLTPAELRELNSICQRIEKRLDLHIEINAFGDEESNNSNERLTRWRALNIVNYFVSYGISLNRIHVKEIGFNDVKSEIAQTASINFYRLIQQ